MYSLTLLQYIPVLDDILEFCDYDLTIMLLSLALTLQITTEYNEYYDELLN